MHKIPVTVELTDQMFDAYEGEARRQGVELERLVEQTVNCLVRELEEEEREGVGDCSPS
jgi:hypothetical protein